jgi:hypothetical protein
MNCKNGVCVLPQYRIKTNEPCPNVLVCYNYCEPEHLKKYGGFCTECYTFFGKWRNGVENLKITDEPSIPCVSCQGTKKSKVYRPNCDHTLCVECFRNTYFGYLRRKPDFPSEYSREIYERNKSDGIEEDWMADSRIKTFYYELSEYENWLESQRKNFFFGTKCFECEKK